LRCVSAALIADCFPPPGRDRLLSISSYLYAIPLSSRDGLFFFFFPFEVASVPGTILFLFLPNLSGRVRNFPLLHFDQFALPTPARPPGATSSTSFPCTSRGLAYFFKTHFPSEGRCRRLPCWLPLRRRPSGRLSFSRSLLHRLFSPVFPSAKTLDRHTV